MDLRLLLLIAFIILNQSCSPKLKGPNYNTGASHNKTNSTRGSVINKEVNRNWKNTKNIRKRSKYSRIANKQSKRYHKLNSKRYIN